MKPSSLLLALLLAAPGTFGQHEGRAAEEGHHRHHVAFITAGSHNTKKDGDTFGADYEFRFTRRAGIVATYEHVGGDFREDLMAFTAAVHPWKGLRLAAGPGFDREPWEREGGAEAVAAETGKRVRGLFRVGGGYDFHLPHGLTIGPDLAVDILKNEKVLVFGINIGFGFGRH
ncbi:MAG: hypothetical protein KatS3mg004_3255 [Bryobacteraceae bacterium]|nr:MAG: hypothetical protein KatS3mg004_3255 [Bryobacteraceae bacterium]